mgnify:FL=1
MTILFVTHYMELYGANRSMLALIRQLHLKYAITPIVVVPHSDGPLLDSLKEFNIQYYVMPYSWWILTYLEPMPSERRCVRLQLKNIKYAFELKRLLRKQNIDMVYTNSVTIDFGVFLAFALRVPHMWHFRESIQQFGLRPTLPSILTKMILHLHINKCFILISDFMVREYEDILPSRKVKRIYNGVSLPPECKIRPSNKIKDILHIACVGQLSTHKNQNELLKALAILKERQLSVHVHFVGLSAPDYIDEMSEFIEKHDLSNMVTIHGHTNNVFSILETCNLGVVTAKNEAFGRVTIEYMLMRMPVIVADSGANPELIDNGVTGMIYHLGNVVELADAIQVYIKNPALLEEQGEKAYEKAVEEFSAEKNADSIYAEMLGFVK